MGFGFLDLSHHTCRPQALFRRCHYIRALIALIGSVIHTSVVDAQETPTAESPATIQTDSTKRSDPKKETNRGPRLQFAFEGTRWREVLTWLADQAGLALHVQDLPVGSFTYSDPKSFTHQEAIDRINLFLLSQGYTIIRSGTLLSVINLSDARSLRQLDVLANLITLNQLDKLPDHEVVKCIFPLGAIKAEDAAAELTALKLMTTPVVFEKTNRLLITDSVRKLKSVKLILDAFEPSALDSGMVMKTFTLQHVEAEDILIVARPHLGLATGEMIGLDVSLSANIQGNTIFVTGVNDKVKMIEGLITSLDKPTKSLSSIDGGAELRSHIIEGGNAETVQNVLQTLLAGKTVRLSVDTAAGSIVALASPDIQEEIAETIAQLQASEAEFEIIQLKTVDPYLVISLLEEMLDLSELRAQAVQSQNQSRGDFSRRGDRGRSGSPKVKVDIPKIDADPGNMRLFVRAKKHQLEQIKKIVAKLDVSSAGSNDKIRIFPLSGKQGQQVLETAAKFWRAPNPIILYRSTKQSQLDNTERVVTNESTETKRTDLPATDPEMPNTHMLTDNIDSQAPAIRCQFTSRGLLLQSDDTVALDQFEKHLRTIAGTVRSMTSPPIVFYLKYTKPDDAIRMLGELLDGGSSASEGEAGSLINGYVSGSSNTFLGSLVTSRDGTTTMMSGTVTVVADSRLNRLIAQGTTSDIEQIESYLKIIDKDSSITPIETYGTSQIIELTYAKARDVAAAIREAYAGRVSGGTSGPGQPKRSGSSQQQAQRDSTADKTVTEKQQSDPKKTSAKTPTSKPARSLEPKMTIAVHEPSNSLIVTAPDQLFKEVEQLAQLIDTRSKQVFLVIPTTNPATQSMLLKVFSDKSRTGSSRPGSRSASPSQPPRQMGVDQQQPWNPKKELKRQLDAAKATQRLDGR